MSRLDEVEAEIANLDDSYSARTYTDGYADLARTLAAEVDELRGKLDDVRMGIGCARGQRSTQFCAEAAQRDAVITKLLDLYKPGSAPEQRYKTWDDYQREYREWEVDCELYRLACEAAKKDPEQ